MDLAGGEDSEARFIAYVKGFAICSADRARGSDRATERLSHRTDLAGRPQERGADGDQDGSGARGSRCCILSGSPRGRMRRSALGLTYVAGFQSNILVLHPPSAQGRREPDLISAKKLALGLPKRAWRTIKWREGSSDWLSSRFARVAARARSRRAWLPAPGITAAGMAADRAARGRSQANQILALHAAGRHQLPPARRYCQAALAHRAGLSGAQAGSRAWAL